MGGGRILRELKRDVFGSVELVEGTGGPLVRRVASGSRLPGSRVVARVLMGRERRALVALEGQIGVPELRVDEGLDGLPDAQGRRPRRGETLLRSYLPGRALHQATHLPRDFFDLLDELVLEVHRRGVCHNDLHKEMNVVVGEDGRPALIDFQLASVHRRRGRGFRARASEDLRHLEKHRRRYTRDGRGPAEAAIGVGHGRRRGWLARWWRRVVKPGYEFVTRRILGTRDGEERRPSSGPWPQWTDPVGERD